MTDRHQSFESPASLPRMQWEPELISGIASSQSQFAQAVASLIAAVLCTALPIFGHLISPVIGGAICLVSAVMMWMVAPAAIPTTLVFSFLFQNTFVAMVITAGIDKPEFNFIRGYNFLFLSSLFVMAAVWALVNWRQLAPLHKYIWACSCALVTIGFYFAIGLSKDPSSAVAYLRNVAGSSLCFAVGLIATWRAGGRALDIYSRCLIPIAIAALAYGYAELLFDFSFLQLFGGDTYLQLRIQDLANSGFWLKKLRETGEVVRDPIDMYRTVLFNSAVFNDLGLRLYRPSGPNFHPISFAYALSFLSICLLARGRWMLPLFALPLLIVVGSKGAIVSLGLAILVLVMAKTTRVHDTPKVVLLLLAAYMATAFIIGFRIGDYHVLGFMGGLHGFLGNPLGGGLGTGGNVSMDMAQIDWVAAQHLGRTNVAVESAIGVMMVQLGLATAIVIGFHLWIASQSWKGFMMHRAPELAMSSIAIVSIVVNGILQEEALFSPLAIGITMLYAGMITAERSRADQWLVGPPPR